MSFEGEAVTENQTKGYKMKYIQESISSKQSVQNFQKKKILKMPLKMHPIQL